MRRRRFLTDDPPVERHESPVTAKDAPPPTHAWTTEQQAICQWFAQSPGHLVVRARAGSGKTSTILEAIRHASEPDILLAAFNKRIATVLQTRVADLPHVQAMTLHALGFQAVRRVWKHVSVDADRAKQLTDAVCPVTVRDSTRWLITRLHTRAREVFPLVTKSEDLIPLALLADCAPDPRDEQEPSVDFVCDYAFRAMEQALIPALTVDFADMIYLPVRLGLVTPLYDLVVVDEAQDMNAAQLIIAQALLKPGGRFVLVGDDRQAIYGFRGADSDSLDRLKGVLGAQELTLTTTFRCGMTIVREAQRLVPDIKAWGRAANGTVASLTVDEMYDIVQPGDFILSRLNAPLVSVTMSLLRVGRRARIEGRDIGQTLAALVRRLSKFGRITAIRPWLLEVDAWENREVARAIAKHVLSKADLVADQAATLRVLAERATFVSDVQDRIAHLFNDQISADDYIICSSVHKAKGLEANRVFALRETFNLPVVCAFCGHRHYAKCPRCGCEDYTPLPSAAQEERNISYVAITRAKQSLYWVSA